MTQTNFTFTYQVSIAIIHKKGKQRTIFIRTIFKMFTMTSLPLPSPPPKKKKQQRLTPWLRPLPREVGSWPTGKIPKPPQELDQARPAEEIWLDALITVLEEASGSGVLVLSLEGGKVIIEIFSKKNKRWDSRRPKGCEKKKVLMCMFDVYIWLWRVVCPHSPEWWRWSYKQWKNKRILKTS